MLNNLENTGSEINKNNILNKSFRNLFHDNFKAKKIHSDPTIVELSNFLNPNEISFILDFGKNKFTRSQVVENDKLVSSDTRTSNTAYLTDNGHKKKYPKVFELIIEKVKALTGFSRNYIENIMLVKYQKGQHFYDHHDYFKEKDVNILKNGGQRIATFFIWLNTVNPSNCGETEFPLINLKKSPVAGNGLFWWNKKNGKMLNKTLHRGNHVKNGEKYGLNIWIREKGW